MELPRRCTDKHPVGHRRPDSSASWDSHERVFTTTYVVEDELPVLRVTRDVNGDLQMLDGVHPFSVAVGRLVCAHHLVERDPSLRPLVEQLPVGTTASRTEPSGEWSLRPVEPPAPWRLLEDLPALVERIGVMPPTTAAHFALMVAARCVAEADWPRLRDLAEPLLVQPEPESPRREELAALYEAIEVQDPPPGTADFRRARAALALWFAQSDDPYEAANEAAFEAHWFGMAEDDLTAMAIAAVDGRS